MEHSYDYGENLERVRRSYDAMVEVRDRKPAEEWKQRETGVVPRTSSGRWRNAPARGGRRNGLARQVVR